MLLYFGRLLAWLKQRDLLPAWDADRPRALPTMASTRHVVCSSDSGPRRCIRCWRVEADCGAAPCIDSRDRPHRVHRLGPAIFCGRCGGYSFQRTRKLHDGCKGRPSGPAVRARLEKMWAGKHPLTGAILGEPTPIGDPAAAFFVLLGPPPKAEEGEEHLP